MCVQNARSMFTERGKGQCADFRKVQRKNVALRKRAIVGFHIEFIIIDTRRYEPKTTHTYHRTVGTKNVGKFRFFRFRVCKM